MKYVDINPSNVPTSVVILALIGLIHNIGKNHAKIQINQFGSNP